MIVTVKLKAKRDNFEQQQSKTDPKINRPG